MLYILNACKLFPKFLPLIFHDFDCDWQYKHTQTPSHSAKYIVAATQNMAIKMFSCSQCWNGS